MFKPAHLFKQLVVGAVFMAATVTSMNHHADAFYAHAETKTLDSGRECKHFKLPAMNAGNCVVEEGSEVILFSNGALSLAATLNCKSPYYSMYSPYEGNEPHKHSKQEQFSLIPWRGWQHNHHGHYGWEGWGFDGDLELEAAFYGHGHRHFDEEFDADLGVAYIEPLGGRKPGEYRYRWTDDRPSSSSRARHYNWVEQMDLRFD
ncbi:MAG: hypothetical protein KC474_12040 [Cyanobacteria bacterium HKST-UBA04]|nr:hypothetical protein [Cyanobacteria bacterium HKST-UBA05]MCA9800271.1 hypothetical protein [Cyanobacteria bacterium HKST-UBA04]